ncbi:carboxypeptidase-like regulatory domain-containing protein [Paludisphaera sp.]|uniref:carboxypeptidase-like regulatory domain-containing protein n=1 Tax=Paludisphaera sp. TaxID=2017432 RepID=UPI00301D3CB5
MRTPLASDRGRGSIAALAVAALLVAVAAGAEDAPPDEAPLSGVVVDESGRPAAGVGVEAVSWPGSKRATTDAGGAFRFSLPTNSRGRAHAMVVARSGDRIGFANRSPFEDGSPEELRIVLRPGQTAEVRVVDRDGRPVEGADVHFLLNMRQVVAGRADADGRWAATVPADPEGWSVYALKAKVGFDYAESRRARGSAEPPLPLPDRLTLTLDGARAPLRVRAIDPEGKPLAGILLGPWIVAKPGREVEMNGVQDAFTRTDADGVVVIDWLPERLEGRLGIIASDRDFYIPGHLAAPPADGPADELTVTMRPFERLSGRVTTPDGRPAAGAVVTAAGTGAERSGFRGETRTRDDGRFQLMVHGEEAYIVIASMDEMVAPPRADVVVRTGKPPESVDLVLGPATRVRGRVTVGEGRLPAERMDVYATLDAGAVPAELIPPGSRSVRGLSMSFPASTDAEGRYELLLGPGEYRLRGPEEDKPAPLTIPPRGGPEVVRDFATPRPERGELEIAVVDGAGRPVAGAMLDGAYQAMRADFSPIRADERGAIRIRRWLDPLVLSAATPDRSRAAVVRLDAKATEARLALRPTASADGRLIDPQGKPIGGRSLHYGVKVLTTAKRNGPFRWLFGGNAETDADGRFHLPGLLLDETYEITTRDAEARRTYTAEIKVLAVEPGQVALGDVPIDLSPPKPYVPPTPAQRAETSFAASRGKSPGEALEAVRAEARREYTRPLLLIGKADDPACVDLFRLFDPEAAAGDAEGEGAERARSPLDLRWEFELASLDASRPEVEAYASGLLASVGGGKPPVLVVPTDEGGGGRLVSVGARRRRSARLPGPRGVHAGPQTSHA